MTHADMLWEIEKLKQLKARFIRYVDTKDDENYLSLYTEDLHFTLTDENNQIVKEVNGKSDMREWLSGLGSSRITAHAAFLPEIEIHDQSNATAIWAMMDYVVVPDLFNYKGYGHYHERYIKDDGEQWRIREARITRLRVDHVLSTV